MVDERLRTYIKYQLKNGHTKENIKNALLNAGHNLDIIERHFKSIEEENPKKSNKFIYLVIFFVAVSILSISLNIVLYSKQNPIQKYDELVFKAGKLCDNGNYEDAFKNLEKAVSLDKTGRRSSAYGAIGKCYLLQNNSIEVVRTLTTAVAKDPNEPRLFNGLGIAYCRLGNYNLGIANLKRSIVLNPNVPAYYNSTAKCYAKAGNQEEAQKYFDLYDEIETKNATQNFP